MSLRHDVSAFSPSEKYLIYAIVCFFIGGIYFWAVMVSLATGTGWIGSGYWVTPAEWGGAVSFVFFPLGFYYYRKAIIHLEPDKTK